MSIGDDIKLGLEQAIEYEKPNKETLEALEEGRRIAKDKSVPGYKTIEELKAALGIKD